VEGEKPSSLRSRHCSIPSDSFLLSDPNNDACTAMPEYGRCGVPVPVCPSDGFQMGSDHLEKR
jgi:hypothetical protein